MKIGSIADDLVYEAVASAKEKETARAIGDLLDGFTIEQTERIIQHVRSNYRNAIYKKDNQLFPAPIIA